MPPLTLFSYRARFAIALLVCVAAFDSSGASQNSTPAPSPQAQWAEQMTRHPELLNSFGTLFEKLQRGVQFPPGRTQSRILPLLPASTAFFVALPNYGNSAHQALSIFRQQVEQDPVLRAWWKRPEVAGTGLKLEDALEKFYRVSQYLGDEIVLTGALGSPDPGLLLAAEIRKPGLKLALQQVVNEIAAGAKTRSGVRILGPEELPLANESKGNGDLLVLVRPDYLVASTDLAVLRNFTAGLHRNEGSFTSAPFGARVARAYQDGVTVVGAVDLGSVLHQVPADNKQSLMMLERTGFADLQYLVWEHTQVAGHDVSRSELSFTGPRRGIAAWLGAPSSLDSLDFVSPKAVMVFSLVLSNPAQMFDDIRQLATAQNPNAFAAVTQMEQALKVDIQQDLLRQLAGEITVDMDSVSAPVPVWKAILKVNDATRLGRTLTALLDSAHLPYQEFDNADVTYHSFRIPVGKGSMELAYTFVDGYLVIASSSDAAIEAVRLHRSGESLAKAKKFQDALPPGHPIGVSALLYQDPITTTALRLRALAPSLAGALAQLPSEDRTPAVMTAYGGEKSIVGASTSTTMDAGTVLIVAAVAIPNLLRARIAANEASAVGSLRTVNTAQAVYASSYPQRGFAHNLAALGPGAGATHTPSAEHAGLIDGTLGCSSGGWCEKSGYRFRVTAECTQNQCQEYVALATPANASSGNRSFCSTSDAVIRMKAGPPLTAAISASACHSWPPLQ